MFSQRFFLQDLEYLSEGLEGRSGNPVAVLFDTLLHPNADFGYEFPSVLQWRRDKKQHIPHLVLGKATPGGAWHVSNNVHHAEPLSSQFFSFSQLTLQSHSPLSGHGRLHAYH